MPLSGPGIRVLGSRRPGLTIFKTSAAPAFNPATYGTVLTWLDATQITGKVDGDAIATWTDASGAGHNAVMATGTQQPLYKTAIQNGKPVVRFDGTNDGMQSAAFTVNQASTWFLVTADRAVAANVKDWTDGLNAFTNLISRRSATTVGLYAGTAVTCVVTTTPAAWHVYGAVFNGASSELRVDGGTAATGNPGAANGGGFTIGGSGSGGGSLGTALDIAEMIVFSGTLSTANRQAVEAALKSKWATP